MADSPIMVSCPLEVLREIKRTLRECAEDLKAACEAEYPKTDRDKYPTYERRYQRDMEPSRRASHLADGMATWFNDGEQ